jgi:hypothetical protein
VGAACFLVLPVLLLGSCMTQAQAVTSGAPTLAEARAEFFAIVDDTERIAGGTWNNQDDPTGRGCELADGSRGRTFSALRLAPAPDLPVTEPIVDLWDDWGFSVASTEIGPVTQLVATTDAHEILIFRVSASAMTLQGESECRPVSTP